MPKTASERIAEIEAKAEAEKQKLRDDAKQELDARWQEAISQAQGVFVALAAEYVAVGLPKPPSPLKTSGGALSVPGGGIRWPRGEKTLSILSALKQKDGQTTQQLSEGIDPDEASKAIAALTAKGWAKLEGGKLRLTSQTKEHEKFGEL